MDALTIACAIGGLLKALYGISQQVHTFIGNTKEVNESIAGLLAELTSIESTLLSIKKCLANSALCKRGDDADKPFSNPVFEALEGSMKACECTLDRFGRAVSGLGATTTSVGGRVVCQIKLDWSKENISTCRSQLQTHIGAMSLALQVVNLLATMLAPSVVIAEIDEVRIRVDEVLTKVDQLSPTVIIHNSPDLSRQPAKVGGDTLLSTEDAVANTNKQLEYLKSSARSLVSSAKSVVAQSEMGDSTWGEEDELHHTRTSHWLDEGLLPTPLPQTAFLLETRVIGDRAILPLRPIADDAEDGEDSDSDTICDFELDVIETWLVTGREAFEQLNYEKAAGFLTKGIEKAERLSEDRRNDSDIQGSKLTLAACYFHLDDLDKAKSYLMMLVKHKKGTKRPPHILPAQHLLAQVLLKQGHLLEAEARCKQALSRLHALKQEKPEAYYESAVLMARILFAQGNVQEAEVYSNMIPPSARAGLANISQTTSVTSVGIPAQLQQKSHDAPAEDTRMLQRPVAFSEASTDVPSASTALTIPDSEPDSTVSSTAYSVPPSRPRGLDDPSQQVLTPSMSASTTQGSVPKKARWPFNRKQIRDNADPANGDDSTTPKLPQVKTHPICDGAHAARTQGLDKGMKTVTAPVGVYGLKSYKTCKSRHCEFSSTSCHPKQLRALVKQLETMDLHAELGIRYKWSFLAASHLPRDAHDTDSRYACNICIAEGRTDDISRREDELLTHLYVDHKDNTSSEVQKKTRCFFGSLPAGTSWDVHIPSQPA